MMHLRFMHFTTCEILPKKVLYTIWNAGYGMHSELFRNEVYFLHATSFDVNHKKMDF